MILQAIYPSLNGIEFESGGNKNRTLITKTFEDDGEKFMILYFALKLK